jgi:hypothetical protein
LGWKIVYDLLHDRFHTALSSIYYGNPTEPDADLTAGPRDIGDDGPVAALPIRSCNIDGYPFP